MKLGILLHPERGVDAVLEEARTADQQGFDSVWLFDHLMDSRGSQGPDSAATVQLVKEQGDGWVMLSSGNPETLGRVLGEGDWPDRPMTLVRNAWMFTAETESNAIDQATEVFNRGIVRGTLDDFLRNNVRPLISVRAVDIAIGASRKGQSQSSRSSGGRDRRK